ncbi:MAG: MacB family efflux pump subunit [Rhodospirillales bacterium]|nr:MacB family efflux pump subunit [Rhodospirillales bacterium]MSP79796.1 MacB family efflux pump subunit [Rhodospirillales bacterium]
MNLQFASPEAGPPLATVQAGEPLIVLENVTKTYRRGALAVEVLHGVSLVIRRGEYVAIMGASGSGKTTLMNLIGCLDRPSAGRYRFAGQDVAGLDRDQLALLRRDALGFIFQQYNLLATASAEENVEVPAIYAGLRKAERLRRARAILAQLGLGERLDHRPSQLSGGEQQRVSVARALMNGGAVILADEPTGALDSQSGREVLAILRRLHAEGHTVILITHDSKIAAEAGRVVTLADGRVVSDVGGEGKPAAPLPAAGPFAATPERMTGALADAGEAVKMALRSLRANLFRSLLTLLGIVIGVGSVVAMLAIGDGAKQEVLTRIQALGTNLLLIRPGAPNVRGGGVVATLTSDDVLEIAKLDNVRVAVPEIGGGVTVRFGNADYLTSATATSDEYPFARDWPVASGIFFGPDEVKSYVPVAALGRTVVANLFPPGFDPIGAYVLINNIPFQVIGTMAAKGATPFGTDMDDVVFVPITTGSLRLFGIRHLRAIVVQIEDVSAIEETQDRIHALLLARHRTVDFQIRNMAAILETATQTQTTLTILLGSIAAISLLVGGIGVMNIMLVSVTERTREIGIRMATGARAWNIMLQFITEAVVVCAVGGVLGVAGGLSVAMAAESFGRPIVLSLAPVLLAFGCAFATGLVFGFMPARKAANLDPVVALSAE